MRAITMDDDVPVAPPLSAVALQESYNDALARARRALEEARSREAEIQAILLQERRERQDREDSERRRAGRAQPTAQDTARRATDTDDIVRAEWKRIMRERFGG